MTVEEKDRRCAHCGHLLEGGVLHQGYTIFRPGMSMPWVDVCSPVCLAAWANQEAEREAKS